MPILWEELDDPDLRPDRWTIRDAIERVPIAAEDFAAALTDDQVLPPIT
jgi:bifunctional non-homologous end joining protein LigD